jgi:hypothetical protein
MSETELPPEEPTFTVGPPQPVTDSRLLPAVTPQDEAGNVHGADLADLHPDNEVPEPDESEVDAVPDPNTVIDDDLPSEEEVDALVTDLDPDDVDDVGFDDTDLAEPLMIEEVGDPAGAQTGGA